MALIKSTKKTMEYSNVSHALMRAKDDFLQTCQKIVNAGQIDTASTSIYTEVAHLQALWEEAGLLKSLCEELASFARDGSRNKRIKPDYLKIWKVSEFEEWWNLIDEAQEDVLEALETDESVYSLLEESEKLGFTKSVIYLDKLFRN